MALHCGVVHQWYGAPFVGLVAIVASWKGREAGFLTALLSMAVMNFSFVPPSDAFSIPTPAEASIYITMLIVVMAIRPRPRHIVSPTGDPVAPAYVRTGSVVVCDAEFQPVYEIRDI